MFSEEKRFDRAYAQIERARSHVDNDLYYLGWVTDVYADILLRDGRFEEAKSEALRAADVFGTLGAATNAEHCEKTLKFIEEKMRTSVASGEPDSSGSR